MPRSARLKSSTGVYHIINRGANRQEIFHDDDDKIKFLETLKRYKIRTAMKVYAWCLMDNHVHLLVKEGNEEISLVMKRIGVSYASYYNWKYHTNGHLFQDRFKSENVETQEYLITVTRYIHQNPVKAGIVTGPEKWKWSSCLGYYGENVYPTDLLECNYILRMFSPNCSIAQSRFKEFNELQNTDKCLEDYDDIKRRLTDEEARIEIKKCLASYEVPQVKSLPSEQRNQILRKVKNIEGLSLRQAARILGVSPNLLFKV
ncbi:MULTISPECIES: transposase [Bacillaceae]|uniref:transposase n=1 Tax=Bacillaceae TaxID=186817 RepID=UPI000BFCC2B8|nr:MULTISPECIES: transposase [Bacillaceae]PGT89040.1 transposase [Bacillus sp. AFS040349]UGB30671.1 transposase [Metabacillus sp. B2-18]